MTLQALLAERQLTTALIVDDAYDDIPLANDLVADEEAWSNFFADLRGDEREALSAAFHGFEENHPSDLQRSDEFVATVWSLRGRLRAELWEPLFQRYILDHSTDRTYLSNLENALRNLGIIPATAGRQIPSEGRQAPLIFVDLFLGSSQSDADIDSAITRIRDLIAGRESAPPLVVLMSRSGRLSDKKAYFRDRALLLSAMFRVRGKAALLEGTTLERTLERLARHRNDALRLAAFLRSWDLGLETAKGRFLTAIRRLDLAEYGQIQKLLLDVEGQPLGSYLLDVFDRVLQHEIEGNPETIRTAENLNRIETDRYPAPYVDGSPDLQDLVFRCLYQHPERLRVKATVSGAPVSFGDVLVRRAILQAGLSPDNIGVDEVLLVITPACDLARAGAKRVLLLAGTVKDLTPSNWSYRANPIRTPILKLSESRRVWIDWDLKDVRTVELADLSNALSDGGTHTVLMRLRENQTLELQQRVLSGLGRVGLIAHMPGTFPVSVKVGFADVAGTFRPLSLETVDREGGVCFVGRDAKSNPDSRLVLSEAACDEILVAIATLESSAVHERARGTLNRLKDASYFASALECGIPAPAPDKTSWAPLKIHTKDTEGRDIQETLGLIVRNPSAVVFQDLRNAGFVLVLRDLDHDEAEPAVGAT